MRQKAATKRDLFQLVSGSSSPVARIVCIPYAGGGPSAYRAWRPWLPREVELVLVAPPGREARIMEPSFLDIGEYAAAICDEMRQLDPLPTHLFGHSMGGIVAYRVGLEPVESRCPLRSIIVSGAVAPSLVSEYVRPFPEDRSDAIRELARIGGTPPAVLENQELLDVACDIIGADVRLLRSLVVPANPVLSDPLVVLAADDDEVAPLHATEAWDRMADVALTRRTYTGGHFFPWTSKSFQDELIEQVCAGDYQSKESGLQSVRSKAEEA